MYLNENVYLFLCFLEAGLELVPKGAAQEGLEDPLGDTRGEEENITTETPKLLFLVSK